MFSCGIIRQGAKLYSGRVDEMTASNGWFEMKTQTDKESLLVLLEKHKNIGTVREKDGLIIANLHQKMDAGKSIPIYLTKESFYLN